MLVLECLGWISNEGEIDVAGDPMVACGKAVNENEAQETRMV
jgi:hypothetical protein